MGISLVDEYRGTEWMILYCNLGGTVDGRNPANHLGCVKPHEEWDKVPMNWWKLYCQAAAFSACGV